MSCTGLASPAVDLALTAKACTHWVDGDYCRSTDRVRPFNVGARCQLHTPAALAGEMEPDEIAAIARRIRAESAGAT